MRVVVVLLALATQAGAQLENPPQVPLSVADWTDCSGLTSANQGLADAITAGGGRRLTVPGNCTLLLTTPGAGNAAVTLTTDTTLACEEGAEIVVDTKTCATGSYVGAACSSDTDCRGGTCGSGAFFATSGGSTYTVIKAASSSARVGVVGCTIKVAQAEPFGRCVGGTSDTLPCASGADCSGGYCGHVYTSQSGPGKINPIDLSAASDATVRDVRIVDHRRGDFSVAVAAGGAVEHVDNTARDQPGRCEGGSDEGESCGTPGPSFSCATSLLCTFDRLSLTSGVRLTAGSARVVDSTITGATHGVQMTGTSSTFNLVERNWIYPAGKTTGVHLSGNQHLVTRNVVAGGWHCVRGDTSAFNVTIADNRCYIQTGAKILASGAGWKIDHNYLAWSAGGWCDGGSRDGQACSTNDTARGTGCPGSSATPKCQTTSLGGPVIQLGCGSDTTCQGSVSHADVSNNIIHTGTIGSSITGAGIAFASSPKRCDAGSRIHLECTTDDTHATTGCPGATCTGCCDLQTHSDNLIVGNRFYAAPSPGIDVSAITAGGNTYVDNVLVSANHFTIAGTKTAVKMPASCSANVTAFDVLGNGIDPGMTASENWCADFGLWQGNGGADLTTDAVVPLRLKNSTGGTLTRYDAVKIDSNANTIKKAPAGDKHPIGVLLEECVNTEECLVATSGSTTCNVDNASTINAGDRLAIDPSNAGKWKAIADGETGFARALEARVSGSAIRCLLQPQPMIGSAIQYPWSLAVGNFAGQIGTGTVYCTSSGCAATESTNDFPSPPFTVQRMVAVLNVAAGSAKSRTVTLRKNAGTTGITSWTCTMSGTSDKECCVTTAASGCDTNSASAASFASGDNLSVEVTQSGGAASTDVTIVLVGTVSVF